MSSFPCSYSIKAKKYLSYEGTESPASADDVVGAAESLDDGDAVVASPA